MKQDLIEALKQLGRGRIDAAEAIAEMLMPEPKAVDLSLPLDKLIEAEEAKAAETKAD